jgi:hypothetical protein
MSVEIYLFLLCVPTTSAHVVGYGPKSLCVIHPLIDVVDNKGIQVVDCVFKYLDILKVFVLE